MAALHAELGRLERTQMKGIAKLIRRCIGILCFSTLLLLILNFLLLIVISASQTANAGPWTTANETAGALRREESGYILSEEMAEALREENVWAIYIDNRTLEVQWHTENLPDTIPLQYTASGIAGLTRGYIDGYPTYTGETEEGLVVLGYPRDRYWKHMWPSWDYNLVKNSPYIFLVVVGLNLGVIFMIYMVVNTRFLRSVGPVAKGIEALPSGEPMEISEKGLLSGLAAGINETSRMLQAQRRELRKREAARANWISGVSHDIRTPLSMVMGYAGQLEESRALSEEDRRKAGIIRQQSLRMKNLINDLNLASKLEYNMQPFSPGPVSLSAIARQSAADFINSDAEGKYEVELETGAGSSEFRINGDKALLLRAVRNLLENSRDHNPQGCHIKVAVVSDEREQRLVVEDDGVGISEEKLEHLRSTPHYMMSDAGTGEPRHGLGLLIVQQIAAAHGGRVCFEHGRSGGFRTVLIFRLT